MTDAPETINTPGADFVAFCRLQIEMLTERVGADRSAVYITAERTSNLIPVAFYPEMLLLEAENARLLNPAIGGGGEGEIRDNRLIMPLMYDRQMTGLLVIVRNDFQWRPEELNEIEKIARVIAIAGMMDKKQRWLQERLETERYRRKWDGERLNTFLHQIRNPLTALKTFGKLLLRSLPAGEGESLPVGGILRESERLRDLIAEFEAEREKEPLDLALPGSVPTSGFLLPAGDTARDTIALETILDPLLRTSIALAEEKNIDIEIDYGNLKAISGNATALREVFGNILDNAIKYTPAGGKITVRGRNLEKTVEIKIGDTGYGIPPEDRNRIFERNYRGVQAKGEIPGTGLGLAIARASIENMGGSIEFYSPNPEVTNSKYPGTLFLIRLKIGEH